MSRMEIHAGSIAIVPRKNGHNLKDQLVDLLIVEDWEDKPQGLDEMGLIKFMEEEGEDSLENMIAWKFEHRYHIFQSKLYQLNNIELDENNILIIQKNGDVIHYAMHFYNGSAAFGEMIDEIIKNSNE